MFSLVFFTNLRVLFVIMPPIGCHCPMRRRGSVRWFFDWTSGCFTVTTQTCSFCRMRNHIEFDPLMHPLCVLEDKYYRFLFSFVTSKSARLTRLERTIYACSVLFLVLVYILVAPALSPYRQCQTVTRGTFI